MVSSIPLVHLVARAFSVLELLPLSFISPNTMAVCQVGRVENAEPALSISK